MNGQKWAEVELRKLTELYPHRPTAEIARELNRTIRKVYAKANILGLRKTKEFLASEESGIAHKGHPVPGGEMWQFPKGNTPFNKGLKRPGYSPGRMRETQFKQGCRSGIAAKNWRPIGTVLADTEGYLRIKVREAVHGKEPFGFGNAKVWPLYNRYLWEKYKGPIPPKHIVAFIDRDRANCVIENLELISMAENARRNRMWNTLPRELAEVIQLNGTLKRQIRRRNAQE